MADLNLHPDARRQFDSVASRLAAHLVPTTVPADTTSPFFQSPFISSAIRQEDIQGEMVWHKSDWGGTETARYFTAGGAVLAVEGDLHAELRRTVEGMCRTAGLRGKVSERTLVDLVTQWLRERYVKRTNDQMSEYVLRALRDRVRIHHVLIPLHQTYIEDPCPIGPITVRGISGQEIRTWFSQHESRSGAEIDQRTLERWLKRLQGRAAVEVVVEAEPHAAVQRGWTEADRAAALLRIFSPGALHPRMRTDVVPVGQQPSDERYCLLLHNDQLLAASDELVVYPGIPSWSIPSRDAARFRAAGLDRIGSLLNDRSLTDLEERLLSALLVYSRCAIERSLSEKLLHIFTALESLLLRNDTEPIQESLAVRVAFLVGSSSAERQKAATLVKAAYRLRSAYIHHAREASDWIVADQFLPMAWQAMLAVVRSAEHFRTRSAFIDALEARKFA